jgi:hypothetical protein
LASLGFRKCVSFRLTGESRYAEGAKNVNDRTTSDFFDMDGEASLTVKGGTWLSKVFRAARFVGRAYDKVRKPHCFSASINSAISPRRFTAIDAPPRRPVHFTNDLALGCDEAAA